MISLYLRLIGAKIRSQMQYKASFVLDVVGFAMTTGIEFAVVAILLGRFESVGGWSLAEVALLYGLSSIGFGFAEMVARGFDSPFERMMRAGAFDGVLTRPVGAFLQVLASEFQLRRLGRIAQGLAVLGFAMVQLDTPRADRALGGLRGADLQRANRDRRDDLLLDGEDSRGNQRLHLWRADAGELSAEHLQ
jgi:ABC-2 type transport system permease protein